MTELVWALGMVALLVTLGVAALVGWTDQAPDQLDGQRLNLWHRLKWQLGFKPFRHCPHLRHQWHDIYGDEILQAGGYRSSCNWCLARSHKLMNKR